PDLASPIGKSWRSSFEAETREQAEQAMRRAGVTWRWLENGTAPSPPGEYERERGGEKGMVGFSAGVGEEGSGDGIS
ncbi:MAG: hypothetical protein SGPRY_005885, partial [Prymnesium sp.]